VNGTLDLERSTVNISDDEKVFVRVETETGEEEVVRYQYDNHLGSACLELDEDGYIISYEEYHPFGTTSYRAGRSETEVSLKRYKYCGKERDEETGLYYYGMRYYVAWICRFVSVDPLQFKYPELTPFQYASNRPITCIDLDGGEAKTPEDQKVIKTPLGGYVNIPANAKTNTFSGNAVKLQNTDTEISPSNGSVSSFTIDSLKYVALFSSKTGEFTRYALESDREQSFTPSSIIYKDKVSNEFIEKVLEISYNLGLDPNKLMAVMAQESNLNPQAKNPDGAVGLIQFTGIAIKQINKDYNLNLTKDDIFKMSAIKQLDLVEKFYSKMAKKIRTIEDFAVTTFAPAHLGKGGG
jgi:RHS repeat-associated protein